MGNSTGSTMYMFGAVIVIYIVGMLIYHCLLYTSPSPRDS